MKGTQRPHPVDWWRVITDLMQSGMTQRDIAARVGCSHAIVNSLRNSITAHEPRFATGCALLALWMEVKGTGAADVPHMHGGKGGPHYLAEGMSAKSR